MQDQPPALRHLSREAVPCTQALICNETGRRREKNLSPNAHSTCPSGQLASGGLPLTHYTLDLGCETLRCNTSVKVTAPIKGTGVRGPLGFLQNVTSRN